MAEYLPEVVEDLIGEYQNLFAGLLEASVECMFYDASDTAGSKGANGQEPDPDGLNSLFMRLHEEMGSFGGRAVISAGKFAPILAREIVARSLRVRIEGDDGMLQGPVFIMVRAALEGMLRTAQRHESAAIFSILADTARAVVAATAEFAPSGEYGRFWQLTLVKEAATFGAGTEALHLLADVEACGDAVGDELSIAVGVCAHAAGDHILAREKLDPVADKLPASELRLLADSCLALADYEEASAHYAQAFDKSAVRQEQYECVLGIGECQSRLELWDDAASTLKEAVSAATEAWETGIHDDRVDFWWARQAFQLLGYSATRADWALGHGLGTGPSDCVRQLDAIADCSVREGVRGNDVPTSGWASVWFISMAAGSMSALIDIANGSSAELNRTIQELDKERGRNRQMSDVVVHLEQFRRTVEQGWEPYKARLLQQFPGLPDRAAQELAELQFDLSVQQLTYRPENIGHKLGVAVECVLRLGLLKLMEQYALTRPEGSRFFAVGDGTPEPIVWIGEFKGKQRRSAMITIKQAACIIEPGKSRAVSEFIQATYKGPIADWLRKNATRELNEIASVRNPSSHADDEKVFRSAAENAMETVLERGLLKRLIEAGLLDGGSRPQSP